MLVALQAAFAACVGQLLTWSTAQGHVVTLGEAYRPPETVALYVAKGVGSPGSVHPLKLAVDLLLYVDGVYQKTLDPYRPLGEYWKTLHPLARWGGDFRPGRNSVGFDAGHFSFEYQGRK